MTYQKIALLFCLGLSTDLAFASKPDFLKLDFNQRKAFAATMTQTQVDQLRQSLFAQAKDAKLSPKERWAAVTSLAAIPGSKSVTHLQQLSGSQDWIVRNASLVAAKEIAPEQAKQMAFQLLTDPALVVRSAAVSHLTDLIEAEDVRAEFWKFVSDRRNFRKEQSLFVRSNALKALAKNPSKNEFRNFLELLDDKDQQINQLAIQGLEKLSNRSFVSQGESLAQQKDKWKAFAKDPSSQKF